MDDALIGVDSAANPTVSPSSFARCAPCPKDPVTGVKHGWGNPHLNQHMAHQVTRRGNDDCDRLAAACDFRFVDWPRDALVGWVVAQGDRSTPCILWRGVAHPHQLWTTATARHLGVYQEGAVNQVKHWQDQRPLGFLQEEWQGRT